MTLPPLNLNLSTPSQAQSGGSFPFTGGNASLSFGGRGNGINPYLLVGGAVLFLLLARKR